MINKVKWKRGESGQAIPFMFEEIKPNQWGWIKYTNSKVHIPDKGNAFSKGYLSFLNAIKKRICCRLSYRLNMCGDCEFNLLILE